MAAIFPRVFEHLGGWIGGKSALYIFWVYKALELHLVLVYDDLYTLFIGLKIIMHQTSGMILLNQLVADGKVQFGFQDAMILTKQSRQATSNILRRLAHQGFLDRVCRGRYAVRQLGYLGTRAIAEDLVLATGAAFADRLHRVAYRSALDEHELLTHPTRTVCIAMTKRTRSKQISGRDLHVVLEPADTIKLGAIKRSDSWVSDLERAILETAARPELGGGISILAEALVAAADMIDPVRLNDYAIQLKYSAALRRIGSIVDVLNINALIGKIEPMLKPKGDIFLEPTLGKETVWRDARWWVRWPLMREELANETEQ